MILNHSVVDNSGASHLAENDPPIELFQILRKSERKRYIK